MNFQGFSEEDFATFNIDGLAARMEAIQTRIQPKFKILGEQLTEDLSAMVGSEMFLHIARHARRTVNPPNDTWLAIAGNKRGYKKHPHFQVCLWDDHVFIWLAFIYELPHKTNIANTFLNEFDEFQEMIPNDYVISLDHMKKDAESIKSIDLEAALIRFRDVKKAELLIGKQFTPTDSVVKDGEAFYHEVKQTFQQLIPIYRLAYQ